MTAPAPTHSRSRISEIAPLGEGRSILHVVTRHVPYGAARNLSFSLELELRMGYGVHIAVGGNIGFDLPRGVTAHSVPHLRRNLHAIDDLRALHSIRSLVGRLRPDIVETHQSKAGVLGRLAARGMAPVVIHVIHMPSFGPGYSPVASRGFLALERYCATFTDYLIAVGIEIKERYLAAKVGHDHQYKVIRSPVDVTRFVNVRRSTPAQKLAWRTAFRIRADARVICGIGLLERRKRYNLVISRLAPLLRSGTAMLVIAGDGPELQMLQKQVQQLGLDDVITFLGFVAEVDRVLAIADVFVHASATEGVPQVVVQAAAAGVPIVSTDAIGIREIPGDSIRIVDADGVGLLPACEMALAANKPPAQAPEIYYPWTEEAIAKELMDLHRHINEALLRGPSS